MVGVDEDVVPSEATVNDLSCKNVGSQKRRPKFGSPIGEDSMTPSRTGSPRVPAAGLGTRVGPRPVPKSSSSLRHISSKGRTVSFGAPLPENRDYGASSIATDDGPSSIQKQFDAARRREQEHLQGESFFDDSESEIQDEDDGDESDDDSSSPKQSSIHLAQKRQQLRVNFSELNKDHSKPPGVLITAHDRPALRAEGPQGRRMQNSVDEGADDSLLLAPGPSNHTSTDSPVEPHTESTIDAHITPRQRLEWHTMLQSVLRSEVLKSETKRITSEDTPSMTREELMYRRWLDIRSSLRGRGQVPKAIELEEKRLREGWPILVDQVLEAIEQCRSNLDDSGNSNALVKDHETLRDSVLEEIHEVLRQVDNLEGQFPSLRKLNEVAVRWNEDKYQHKLSAMYSWYNVSWSLRLQVQTLQVWTGSKTLDVESRPHDQENAEGATDVREQIAEGTFLERILKENSLQSTFEKGTLRTLHKLIMKAKDAIARDHQSYSSMRLPSFEPELVKLINFPTRLMEAALQARLDYVSKLNDPNVFIVDSLIEDLRAAIALACRIKLEYSKMIVPDPSNGWDLPSCIGDSYDEVLREALRYFFKLLNYKLKGSLFFKETEILEPEWRFLATAVKVVEGADVLVAQSITKIVNKLFSRIVNYFERELSAPSTRRLNDVSENVNHPPDAATALREPPMAGGLTRGHVRMTIDEKARWIHQVFDSVRIRNRKLLGFSRDIRNRLENSAEYDLNTLRSPYDDKPADISNEIDLPSGVDGSNNPEVVGPPHETHTNSNMDLTEFLQRLIDAGFFLVLTGTFETEGIYILAEPSLHDRPELVQELFSKCLRSVRSKPDIIPNEIPEDSGMDDESEDGLDRRHTTSLNEEDPPHYLLILSPRDAFMWTGKVMYLAMDRIDVDLKDRRLRLIADGTQNRLALCKQNLYSFFGAIQAKSTQHTRYDEQDDQIWDRSGNRREVIGGHFFPLDIIDSSLAHMSSVQSELSKINKGVYMLTTSVIRSVPKIRIDMRRRRRDRGSDKPLTHAQKETSKDASSQGGDCDELIQNCYSRASEQGFRALPFIESDRLRGQTMLALARLAIDWVAFICDDCEPTDPKTFKWAVAALENAMTVTQFDAILTISEKDFILMRSKVASCVGLLISHFDILGARSSAAKAKEEEKRLERERAEKTRMPEPGKEAEFREEALRVIQGTGVAGAPPMLNRHDSGMEATEERWVQKVMEWDAARQTIESEQRLIGRVLDDTRLEDRGLQFLASSSSRIQIRWQQGRFIGGGTFGTVYLGVSLDTGGLMAVKEIRFQDINSTPGMYKQIKDEMSVMEMLSHPNIVEYYGIEVHRDKVYIFEEYCQGGSLAQLLEHGRIEDEMVTQVYTLQMLDGLVYLHSKGVVHRDIKPDNILLDHMGVIKFVDFGAAKVLAKNSKTIQRSRRPGITGPGSIAGMVGSDGKPAAPASLQGTPMYMSPEVIKGETRGRRGAMDVWSLGCVVLEFATGQRPWSQLDNEWAIMFHIGMAQQHPPLPDISQMSELGIDFIRQCLIIDPYERPSAAEMREHPWIQNLVEELNAANEEEANGTNTDATSVGDTSHHGPHSHSFVHGSESAAGVAAMAATPGTRTLNGFQWGHHPAPSLNSAASSFSRPSSDSSGGRVGSGLFPAQYSSTTLGTGVQSTGSHGNIPQPEYNVKPHHDPGHPNHQHPGSEALIADLAYEEEEKQRNAMVALSEIDSSSVDEK